MTARICCAVFGFFLGCYTALDCFDLGLSFPVRVTALLALVALNVLCVTCPPPDRPSTA